MNTLSKCELLVVGRPRIYDTLVRSSEALFKAAVNYADSSVSFVGSYLCRHAGSSVFFSTYLYVY